MNWITQPIVGSKAPTFISPWYKFPKQHGQVNFFLENFPKKPSHFKEESYEIANIFVQISSFLLLKLPNLDA
jgi:hypothetical protein